MNEDLSGLNLIDLLERLQPIPEPAPVSWLPQTAGWAVIGVLLAAAALWLAWRWRRHRRINAYRRAALAAIAGAKGDPAALAAILRRTALAAYPRVDVAGLYGDAWLAFLDQAYGGSGFSSGPGRGIAAAPYAPHTDAPDLAALAAQWVRQHRAADEAAA